MKKPAATSKAAQKNMGMSKVRAIPAAKARMDSRDNREVSSKGGKR